MATAQELERLVIKLVGEGSDYKKVLDSAVRDTDKAVVDIERSVKGAMGAQNKAMREAAKITKAARTPTERYAQEVRELEAHFAAGRVSAETYRRTIARLNKEFQMGNTHLTAFGARVKKVGRGMRNAGVAASIGLTLPLAGVGLGMLKAAADAEETNAKFNVVFSDVASGAKEATEGLRGMGVSQDQAKKLIGNTGDLLTGFGFDQKSALDVSKQVNTLAADLASFTNIEGGVERASGALTKALFGETEMAKSLGIVIKSDGEEYKKLMKQFMEAEGMTENQAKAMTTLTIATNQSKNAIGDFHRSQASLTNQFKIFKAAAADIAVELGTILIPIAQKLLGWARQAVEWFGALSPAVKKMAVMMGLLAAVIGPVLLGLGLLGMAIGGLASGLGALIAAKGVILAMAAPVVLIVAKVALLAAGVWAVVSAVWGPGSLTAAFKTMFATGIQWAKALIGFIANLGHNFRVLMEWLPKNWKNVVSDIFQLVGRLLVNTLHNFSVFTATIIRVFTVWQGFMVGVWKRVFSIEFLHWVGNGIKKAAELIGDFAAAAWDGLKKIFTGGGSSGDLTKIAEGLVSDFGAGMKTKNIAKEVARIVAEQAKHLRTPFEGFQTSLEDLPAFKMGDTVEEITKAMKPVQDAVNEIPEKIKIAFEVTGIEAVIAGTAEAQARLEEYRNLRPEVPKEAAAVSPEWEDHKEFIDSMAAPPDFAPQAAAVSPDWEKHQAWLNGMAAPEAMDLDIGSVFDEFGTSANRDAKPLAASDPIRDAFAEFGTSQGGKGRLEATSIAPATTRPAEGALLKVLETIEENTRSEGANQTVIEPASL
jgi:hypothetical protein